MVEEHSKDEYFRRLSNTEEDVSQLKTSMAGISTQVSGVEKNMNILISSVGEIRKELNLSIASMTRELGNSGKTNWNVFIGACVLLVTIVGFIISDRDRDINRVEIMQNTLLNLHLKEMEKRHKFEVDFLKRK